MGLQSVLRNEYSLIYVKENKQQAINKSICYLTFSTNTQTSCYLFNCFFAVLCDNKCRKELIKLKNLLHSYIYKHNYPLAATVFVILFLVLFKIYLGVEVNLFIYFNNYSVNAPIFPILRLTLN